MAGGFKFNDGNTLEQSYNTQREGLSSVDDLDTFRDDGAKYGFYSWGGSAPTNAPTTYMLCLAMNDSNQGMQIAWGDSSGTSLYTRRAPSGTWSSWTSH